MVCCIIIIRLLTNRINLIYKNIQNVQNIEHIVAFKGWDNLSKFYSFSCSFKNMKLHKIRGLIVIVIY